MTRRDFQQLAEKRLQEAESLLKVKHYEGAFHLGGLSLECAIKACIARQTKRFEFPEKMKVLASYEHDLTKLIKVAGLEPSLRTAVTNSASNAFATNWAVVSKWQVDSRYDVKVSKQQAERLVLAMTHPTKGVLQWLRSHW